ncbi:MAG: hypothetical protein ACKVXR_09175 [Planctomycetota bacterium]
MRLPRRGHLAFLAVAGTLLAVAAWCGCASTVTPPKDPPDPIVVHLLSTGRHAGVLLPNGDGRTVEYGYGDWTWYALGKDDWWRAPAVVLWPTQGTLGRRYVLDADLAAMNLSYGGGTLEELRVSRDSADRLLARLDTEFVAGGEGHFNPLYDMSFVKHPDGFWMFHDCHDEVAEWLEELECDVGWAPIRAGLRVVHRAP